MKKQQNWMQKLLVAACIAGIAVATSCAKKENILVIDLPPSDNPQTENPGGQGQQTSQKVPSKESLIYLQSGAPSPLFGDAGDMYIDKKAGKLYGPKQGTKWGVAHDLVNGGAANTNDKGSLLTGSGAPGTKGATGDYYINTDNGDLFGPKAASGWGNPINLTGKASVAKTVELPITWSGTSYMKVQDVGIPAPMLNSLGITSAREIVEKNGGKLVAHIIKGAGSASQTPYELPYSGKSGSISYEYTLSFTGDNSLRLRVRTDNASLPADAFSNDIRLQFSLSKK